MVACIFGASGLVGTQLMFICLHDERISRVKIFVRKPLAYRHEKLEQVITGFKNPQSWEEHLRGAMVYCSVGTTIRKAGSKEAFREVDLRIPALIAEFSKQAKAECLTLVSSMGANSRSRNFYLRTKGEAEEAVISGFGEPVILIRPSMLLGNRKELRIGEILAKYLMIFLDKITFKQMGNLRPVQAADVARAALQASFKFKKGVHVIAGRELFKLAESY